MKTPRTAEGYYLAKLIKQCFSPESGTGVQAFYDALKVELERRKKLNFLPRYTTTITNWCEKRGLNTCSVAFQREVAAAVIVSRLPSEERAQVTAQLLGESELPQVILDEFARLVGKEKGPTFQNAGPLISSAVRAWTGLFGIPDDAEEYTRANDDLTALKHMFRDHLSLREFAEAASQLFHRNTDPEFRLNLFTYAVGRLSERHDLTLEQADGRWDSEFAQSARALVKSAWVFNVHRNGSDDDLSVVVGLFGEFFAKALSGKREAPLFALACCVSCQTIHPYPVGVAPSEEQLKRLVDVICSSQGDALIFRSALLLAGKAATFHENTTARFVTDYMASSADLSVPRAGRAPGALWLPQMTASDDAFGTLSKMAAKEQVWVVRYPILTFAYRNNLKISGVETIANDILLDVKASDESRREALCYLARVADRSCQSILLKTALSENRDQYRAIAAICAVGTAQTICELLNSLPSNLQYERRALLDAMAMQLTVLSLWDKLMLWSRLRRDDRRYLAKKSNEVRVFLRESIRNELSGPDHSRGT